jgi:predicted ATPase/DNA-binding SARP family transcriptional activator
LWPEHDQQRAQASLRRHLSELNISLGGGWLTSGQAGVGLARPAGLWVDVVAFRRFLATCHRHDHAPTTACPACIEALTNAVTLYRADFLSGFTLPDAPAFDEWQFFQSEELRQSYASALEKLVQAHDAQNEKATAISYARRRLSLDPLHEAAHRQLMQLYASNGQQSAALRQYELCVQTLRNELDVAPATETTTLYEQIRRGEIISLGNQGNHIRGSDSLARHNLPAPTTSFVGRVKEIAALTHLCHDEGRRLITILGPGGIGKTRLVLEVAARLLDSLAAAILDGIYFVRLAQIDDAANIVPTIATTLNFQFPIDGRTPKQQLFDYLQQKQMILVLDNFEQLLDGVGLVQELLQSCPTLRLLVTSRERLQLMSETVFTVGSLDLPPNEMPASTQGYEAMQLFIETAQRIRFNGALTSQPLHPEETRQVARICRLVGGMPLGIILAASWVEVLSPAEIAAELAKGFDLLETELHDLPARQQSMRAVLAYSWQRLTEREQAVLMRLALFRGGFTRAAAEEIAGASLSILVRLVDKSFVQRTGERRYEIHELVRQFAEQQLEDAGARPDMQRGHGLYYLNLLHECESKMAGPEQLEAINRLEADFENIRAAWLWAVQSHNYALVNHALDGLFHWFFWLRRNRQQEGLALLQVAYQTWTPQAPLSNVAEQTPHPVWGRIQSRLLEQQGPWLDKSIDARKRIERSLILAQQEEDESEIFFCVWALGLSLISEQALLGRTLDLQSAIARFEACLVAYRASNDLFWIGQTLEKLGHAYRRSNQSDLAIPLLQESLALRSLQGDRFGIARSLRELAWARLTQGMEEETFAAAQAAYELQIELGDQQGIADSRFFLALCLLCCGDWQRAKELLIPVQQLSVEMNSTLYQRWSSIAFAVATYMEENSRLRQSSICSFPNHFNPFTTRLFYLLYSLKTTLSFSQNLQILLGVATSDAEKALCLLFSAELLWRADQCHRAAMLLAAALRHPEVVESWVMQIPEIVALPQELRNCLSPAEFSRAWEEGQALDLQAAVAILNRLPRPK